MTTPEGLPMVPPAFEIKLEERLEDRVSVSVVLTPRRGSTPALDGVAVQLVSQEGEPLSPRTLLPIAGELNDPLSVGVELRSAGAIPPCACIRGVLWWGRDEMVVTCPAEPWTRLETHMRGRCCTRLDESRDVVLRSLEGGERDKLVGLFSWMKAEPPPQGAPDNVEVDSVPEADELAQAYGLDEEDAEWLHDLLTEEE